VPAMDIRLLDPESPAARRLIAQSDAYMAALYPAESNHLESVAALKSSHVLFVGGWIGECLAGCGAVKRMSDDGSYGEIKRLFVAEEFRGRGLSKAIMHHLEADLRERRILVARLETGISQPEAIGLYRALGYVERVPFGAYRPDPLSIFMEKRLVGERP
jgi:putative acetyltransferase